MSLIIAHRGASGYMPEMTMPSYQLALSQGADGFETDVRLTKDGQLVCVHDRKTKRVADQSLVISNSTLTQLQELDFSEDKTPAKILLISELIEFSLSTNKSLNLLIETKHITKYHGKLEESLSKLLTDFNLVKNSSSLKIFLMSFNPFAVQRFQQLMPQIPRVQLVEKNYPFLTHFYSPGNPQISGPGIELLIWTSEIPQRKHKT